MKRILTVIALAAALVVGAAAPASAGVDDFRFSSFDAVYQLGIDDDGHSTLTTTETLVAVFPEFDQNRGVRRSLNEEFDGRSSDLKVVSVEDESGNPRPFEAESEDDVLTLTIASDDYVHGEQTYVITYTQRNVTKFFADTNADEFYWDTNGTDWSQPFDSVTATVEVDTELMSQLTGKADAASGTHGERGPAAIETTGSGYRFGATDLGAHANLTFAIGFKAGTFTPRASGFFDSPFPSLALFFALLSVVIAAFAVVVRRTRLQDAPGRGIIVPEYVPPTGSNLLLASVILGKQGKAAASQIVKLAVAGNLRILEIEGKKGNYRLEFLRSDDTDADEQEFLRALFGKQLTPGAQQNVGGANERVAKRMAKLMKRVTKDATANDYRAKVPAGLVGMFTVSALIATLAAFIFAAISLDDSYGGVWPALFIALAVGALVLTVVMLFRTPLKAKGVELRDYLRGLKLYIKLAEADRLRYLQSPEGALRTPVATDDTAQVVKLNEKLLPYAMLFGQEKRWAAELGEYYEKLGTEPSWYVGQNAFNGAIFASSIGSIGTSTASAYTSSSGGSGGGSFSGGGGGGGGGGGV